MTTESTPAQADDNHRLRLGLSGKLLILTILFVMMAEVLIFVPTIPFFWATPSPEDLAGLIIMGLVSGAGQFLIILPFRYASAATLGPVQYFSIVGGVLVGYFWFAEMPGWTTIIGALIVMSAMRTLEASGCSLVP